MKIQKLFIPLVALIVLAAAYFIYQSIVYKTEISEFDLKAGSEDISGVASNTHFVLKTTAPLTAQVIEKYLTVMPEVDIDVRKIDSVENTFEIIPEKQLSYNQIYTFEIKKGPLATRDFSWAYQVKAPFSVVSSIPGDKSTDVPLNTGIEIDFNRENIQDTSLIEISPKVDGRFEKSGTKVRFIPLKPLQEKTLYTVKINRGLSAAGTTDVLEKEIIIQFETTASFINSNSNTPHLNFIRAFTEFTPGDPIVFAVWTSNVNKATINVYKFNSADEFIHSSADTNYTSWGKYRDIHTVVAQAHKVYSADALIEKTSEYNHLIRLSEALPVGYYAILSEGDNWNDVAWFQVHPAASYTAFSNAQSLVWLKNSAGGENIKNVPIFFDGIKIGETGHDGVALIETPEKLIRQDQYYTYTYNAKRQFIVAKTPTLDLVIPIENEYGSSMSFMSPEKWWKYVSLNKNIYLTNDTIRFWAVIKPREGSFTREIKVKLTDGYWEYDRNKIVYAETTLKPSEFGTVTGELSFENLNPKTYELTFFDGDEIVARQTVSVASYIKPAYKIEVTAVANSIFAGDSATFKIKAQFFDGTPVAFVPLNYRAYGPLLNSTEEGNIQLDKNGEAEVVLPTKYSSIGGYWPSNLSLYVNPSGEEEGQIEGSSTIFVFGSHIKNEINREGNSLRSIFSVKSREVVIKNSARLEPYWYSGDYLGNPVPGTSTRVDVALIIYNKKQTGTYYDPINKLTYPVYTYSTEERKVTESTITGDKQGVARFTFEPERGKTYKVTFTTMDNFGRIDEQSYYVYGGGIFDDLYDRNARHYLKSNDEKPSYKTGERVSLRLSDSNGTAPSSGKEKFIFLRVNNGTMNYSMTDDPETDFIFEEKDIPNVGVWPAWFDGKRFMSGYLYNISFDSNERRLMIAVTGDKEVYKPGDTVNLDFKVTDTNAKPKKAEINLSALDEAVFSLRPYETDIVENLYRDIYSPVSIRTSNALPYGGGGAEKGGGGDETSLRSNIREMAIFKTITTDSSGNASLQFKLPDNITSWRLTSQALTKDMFAGKKITFIPVSLPFFVDTTLNNSYLTSDKLIVRVRTFGNAGVRAGITYTVQSPTLPFKKIEITGGDILEIPVGELTKGAHELTVKAQGGGYSDAVARTIHVRDSYFVKESSDFYEAISGLKIKNNAQGYTELTFSSYGQGRLYNELKSMTCQCGMRIDQKGSARVAMDLLNKYFGEKNELPEFPKEKYQEYDGGIQLLPYGSDDLELSALTAHLMDDGSIDRSALKRYLSNSISDEKADVARIARALFGLTAFKEPVLTKLLTIKDDKHLQLEDKVFIALGLDALGAKESARSYYAQTIKPHISQKQGYAYVDGLKGDSTVITTTLVAALAASLEENNVDLLATYFRNNYPKETLNNFERLLYIKKSLPHLEAGEVSFAYKAKDKKGSASLKNGETFTLTLSKEELSNFELYDVHGKLGIVTAYKEEVSPKTIIKDQSLSLGRTYTVNGIPTNRFKEGDLVKVELTPGFGPGSLYGAYTIVDYLPSGLRPVTEDSHTYYTMYSSRLYPDEINDQKITFVTYQRAKVPIYYYARVVSKGTYKAEPALLESTRNVKSITISNEDHVIVE
jgi:alpha-2-macroglobulin